MGEVRESDKTVFGIVPGKTDADLAADFKNRIIESMQPVFKVIDEASAAKFDVQFGVGANAMGKQHFTALKLMRVY